MQFSVYTLLPTELILLSEYDFKLQINEEIVHSKYNEEVRIQMRESLKHVLISHSIKKNNL